MVRAPPAAATPSVPRRLRRLSTWRSFGAASGGGLAGPSSGCVVRSCMASCLSVVLVSCLGPPSTSADDHVALHPVLGRHRAAHALGVAATGGEATPGEGAGLVDRKGEHGGRESTVGSLRQRNIDPELLSLIHI